MIPCDVDQHDQNLTNSESNYFTTEDFNSRFNPQSTNTHRNHHTVNDSTQPISFLHINARSLNKNFDSIELLLLSLKNFPFSVIGVSETWLHKNSPPMFNIDNYQILRSDRGHGKGGGVALYTHNDIKVKLRPDLSVDGTENLFIEILNVEKRCLFKK